MSKSNVAKQESAPATGASEAGFGSVFNDAGTAPASGVEFQTNFGGESSAMGDIFKAGQSSADDKKKRLIFLSAAGATLLLCLGAVMFLLEDEPADNTPTVASTAPAASAVTAPPPEVAAEQGATDDAEGAEDAAVATNDKSAATPSQVVGDTTYAYNEKDGGPVVTAADGAVVEVSRKADFSVPYVAGKAKGGKFRIPNPPPGNVYWREQGSATAHKISVSAPAQLSFGFSAPGTMSAGESLSWKAAGDVAFYRVEFSADPTFENVAKVLATSKTSVAVKEVGVGKYHVRLAAFNTAAGRWEYSTPSPVEVK